MELSVEEREALSPEEIAAIEDDVDDHDGDDPLEHEKEGEHDAQTKAEAPEPSPAHQPFLLKTDPLAVTDARIAMEKAERQLEAGEISPQDYDRARRAYDKATIKNEFINELNSTYRNSGWECAQASFFDSNRQYSENRTLNRLFANTVNELMKTPEGQAMSDNELLQAAKDRIEGDLRTVHAGAVTEKDHEAGTPQNDDSLFSRIDRLTGQAFQDAIDRLSPEQLERYEERT